MSFEPSRTLHAIAWGAMSSGATYMILRVYERITRGVLDPLASSLDLHTGYYWRALVATWLGAATAWLVWLACRTLPSHRRGLDLASHALPWLVVAVVVASTLCP